MKTSSAKSKGRSLQQLVRDKIIELLRPWGIVAEDVKSTSMGASGEDVQLSPRARSYLPVSIECKSYKEMAVYKWYEQAKVNSGGNIPLLVIKANNKKPLVVIDLDRYLFLEYVRLQGNNDE
jgi:hypothetical protein